MQKLTRTRRRIQKPRWLRVGSECIRTNLRKSEFEKISRGGMPPDPPSQCGLCSLTSDMRFAQTRSLYVADSYTAPEDSIVLSACFILCMKLSLSVFALDQMEDTWSGIRYSNHAAYLTQCQPQMVEFESMPVAILCAYIAMVTCYGHLLC